MKTENINAKEIIEEIVEGIIKEKQEQLERDCEEVWQTVKKGLLEHSSIDTIEKLEEFQRIELNKQKQKLRSSLLEIYLGNGRDNVVKEFHKQIDETIASLIRLKKKGGAQNG